MNRGINQILGQLEALAVDFPEDMLENSISQTIQNPSIDCKVYEVNNQTIL